MAGAKKKNNHYALKKLWILILLALFFSTSSSISPLWATYVLKLGGNLKTSGIAIAVNSACFAIFNVVWGWLESIYSNEKCYIIGSFLIVSLLYGLYPFVKTPIELYVLQVPIGAFSAMMGPALFKLYNEHNQERLSRFGWGVYTAQMNLFVAVGAVVGAHVAHNFGFDAVFYMMSVLSFAAGLSAAFIL